MEAVTVHEKLIDAQQQIVGKLQSRLLEQLEKDPASRNDVDRSKDLSRMLVDQIDKLHSVVWVDQP